MASRIANSPLVVPKNVTVTFNNGMISVKGAKGTLQHPLPSDVTVVQEESALHVRLQSETARANMLAGTQRALINNMLIGVTDGFEEKLELVGVGYRSQVQGKQLNLTLGFSHPVNYVIPAGITIETPSQTEILIKGTDKRLVGQVAADIRSYRYPEPYKGKGVRYTGEKIVLKETKKK